MPDHEPTPAELLQMDLSFGSDDWKPTPHGQLLSRTLAEHNLVRDKEVLELGAGVANQTIVMLRQGAKRIVATEMREDLLQTTRHNVTRNCPAAVIEYRVADWLDTEGKFDVIVSNPPFAKGSMPYRRHFIDALIKDAPGRLRPGGRLVFVQSSMADIAKTRAMLEANGFEPHILATSEGPFRDYYFEDAAFMEEIRDVPNGFEMRDGVYYEMLFVIDARLKPAER